MDGKMLARVGAVIFVAIAITAAAIEISRNDEPRSSHPGMSLQSLDDPLRQNLRRCQRLGEAALSDSGCLSVWAESRDRFLGRSPALGAPERDGER